jgi:hypothetical protein
MVRAGKSYDEIARALGYANRGSAWRLVQNALQSAVTASIEEHRAIELERLDAFQHAHWEQACTGDSRSAQIVLKVIEQRIRLLGLTDAAKSESGPISIYQPGG